MDVMLNRDGDYSPCVASRLLLACLNMFPVSVSQGEDNINEFRDNLITVLTRDTAGVGKTFNELRSSLVGLPLVTDSWA